MTDYDALWTDTYGDMQSVGPVHRHLRRLMRELLADLRFGTVAEVGCGAGHNFDLFGGAVVGYDLSPVALEAARERHPQAELRRLDIEREASADRYDLVVCSLVLEHLADDQAALRNLRAMTGGHALLTTIAGDYERYRPWEEQVGHVRNYRRGELEEKLRAAGFTPVRVVRWGFPLYTPLVRTLQNRMTSEPAYDRRTRLLAALLYRLFFLNSRRRGDLLVVVAR